MNAVRSYSAIGAARPFQNLGRGDALLFQRRQAAGKHRLADQRHRHAEIERADARPFAGAFLAGGIQNLVHQRLAIVIFLGENFGRDLDEDSYPVRLCSTRRTPRASSARIRPRPSFNN